MGGDVIQEYSFKRGLSPDIARIRELLKKDFPAGIEEENGKLKISYGAFKLLTVWLDKKKLCIDSESNKDIADEAVLDTNKRYRVFLEEATGYTSKERLARAKKEVGG